jgi:predicted RNase H-like HicB family nuclease
MMSKGVGQMDETNAVAREYLKAPYSRILIPDDETGTYTAKIAEFPGCIAQGDSPAEAYRNLEAAAESWINELLGMGEEVPDPAASNSYSGRIALRLPKSLHRSAAQLAEQEGTSLNQFLVAAIAERVGSGSLYAEMAQRLQALTMPSSAVHVYMHGPYKPMSTRGFTIFESPESPANTSRSLVLHGPTEED